MKSKPSLTILANAFVTEKSIGGGDRFIIEVAPQLCQLTKTTIITSEIGLYHWKQSGLPQAKFITTAPTIFDNHDHPLAIFLTYLIRSFQATQLARTLKTSHLITASQYLPDLAPAFWAKRADPNLRWIARIYHLIPPPTKRAGNFIINSLAYLAQILMIKLVKKADLIITDNKDTKQKLIKRSFSKKKVEVLPSGINFQNIRKHRPRKRHDYQAAYIGRLDPHRGIFDLPDIWEKVIKKLPRAKLAIVGYGPKKTTQKLKNEFSKKQLSQTVDFIGFLPHKKGKNYPLFDLLRSIKCLLLPIHEGGWPLTVAESLALGTPVVAYNLPIFSSLYSKGVVTSKTGDKTKFSRQVTRILQQKDLKNGLSKEGQKLVSEFDYKKISDKFAKLCFSSNSIN